MSSLPLILPHILSRAAAGESLQDSGLQADEACADTGTPACWDCGTNPWQFGAGAGGEPRLGHHGSSARAGQSSLRLQAALTARRLPVLC